MSPTFNKQLDLISLHFDHAPDLDDGHAVAAGKVLLDTFGITRFTVAGGTHGLNGPTYNPLSEVVMDAAWGVGGWLNAHSDRANAIVSLGQAWLTTIKNGGRVWVQEGGQADVTLAAAQYVKAAGGDPTKITVVQHSVWNINQYGPGVASGLTALGVVQTKIGDGNFGLKGTADLAFGPSPASENFAAAALSSQWSNEWAAAFDYFPPTTKVDFSDTVELLHILGVSIDRVADIGDFAREFLPKAPDPDAAISIIVADAISDVVSGAALQNGDVLTFGAATLVAVPKATLGATKVRFDLSGPTSFTRTESVAPFALAGDRAGDLFNPMMQVGSYSLTVTALGSSNQVLHTDNVQFSVAEPTPPDPIIGFSVFLANATNDVVSSVALKDGGIIDFGTSTLVAVPDADLGAAKVRFDLSGPTSFTRIEGVAPFALGGDTAGDLANPMLAVGSYNLTLTALDSNNQVLQTSDISFSVA
jgi:hypothetical protein